MLLEDGVPGHAGLVGGLRAVGIGACALQVSLTG